MKKIYKVTVKELIGCEGKYNRPVDEYVATDDINAYLEVKRIALENTREWWMHYAKEYGGENHGRPLVTAEELEIKEV